MLRKLALAFIFCSMLFTRADAAFDPCKFNFGVAWDGYQTWYKKASNAPPAGLDYIAIWLTENDQNQVVYNQYWHGTMATYAKKHGLTQVFVGYIIAKLAKVDAKLNDCDNSQGGETLCSQGANYIRTNRTKIIETYKEFAAGLNTKKDEASPPIFLMEPDYIQYSNSSQNGGGLSYEYLGTLMKDIVQAILSEYPTARFSMDISPWVNDPSPWYQKFQMTDFSFMNTSGGRTEGGNERIRMDNNNNVTWKQISQLTGKTIIADAGYGVGGACDGSGNSWSQASNIENRIKDGVVGLTLACPSDAWLTGLGTFAASIKGKPTCTDPTPKFTLTLTPGTGGSITTSPSGTSFTKGTSVQLTAVPSSGYKFSAWGGGASGSVNPLTVTMDAAKTISATFVADNTPELTIGTAANGSVAVAPVMPVDGYVKGSTVTVTATPAAGYQLVAWTGAVTGNANPLSLKMDSGMTITPIFRKIGEVTNLVKGGDGASTTNWTVVSNPSGATLTTAADPKDSKNTVLSTKGNYGEKSGEEAFMVTQGGIQVTAGTTYFLSFRAMVSSPDDTRGAHPLGVKFENGSTTAFKVSDSVKQDTSWHLYSYSFKATATGTATLSFLLGNGGDRNWQSVLIDDVILSDAPPVAVVARNVVRQLAMKVVGSSLDLAFVAEQGDLRIDAVSPSGEVRNLVDRRVEAGSFRVAVPVSGLRNGVYSLRIHNGNSLRTGTFSVVK